MDQKQNLPDNKIEDYKRYQELLLLGVSRTPEQTLELNNLALNLKDYYVDRDEYNSIAYHVVTPNRHLVHLGITTNDGNNYSLPGTISIDEGILTTFTFSVYFNVGSTGNAYLKLPGFDSFLPIVKRDGTPTKVKKGVYLLFWEYSRLNFQLLGEGGEYGTAQEPQVLTPYTIGTEDGVIQGTMPDRGTISDTITTQSGQITISQGYHNGNGKINANITNLVAENVKHGTNVGGVVGTLPYVVSVPTDDLRSPLLSTTTTSTSYVKVIEFRLTTSGEIRLKFRMSPEDDDDGSSGNKYAAVYLNDVQYDVEHIYSASYNYIKDITVAKGDYIAIYSKRNTTYTIGTKISNCGIYYGNGVVGVSNATGTVI